METDRRRNDTKIRIMKNAITLFSEKGLDAVSIRDITGKTAVSTASFYNHFKTKDELLKDIFDYYNGKIIKPVENNYNIEGMIVKLGVKKFLKSLIELMFNTEHDEELYLLSRVIAMEQFKNPVAAEIAYKSRKKSRDTMAGIFKLMAKNGLIQVEKPKLLADTFSYMLVGISTDYYYQRYILNMTQSELLKDMKTRVNQFYTNFLKPD